MDLTKPSSLNHIVAEHVMVPPCISWASVKIIYTCMLLTTNKKPGNKRLGNASTPPHNALHLFCFTTKDFNYTKLLAYFIR